MLYLLGEMLGFMLAAGLAGLLVGWLLWGRTAPRRRGPRHAVPRHPVPGTLLVNDIPTGDVRVLPRRSHRAGPSPAGVAASAVEPAPVAEPGPAVEPEPAAENGPAVELGPAVEFEPAGDRGSAAALAAEFEPAGDRGSAAALAAESWPTGEPVPVAESGPVAEPEPAQPGRAEQPAGARSAADVPIPQPRSATEPDERAQPASSNGAPRDGDDLRRVAGIGPVTSRALVAAGITTYRQLARLHDGGAALERVRAELVAIAGPGSRGRVDARRWAEGAKEQHFRKYGERL
jgi:predicted flap endonuclease-1-like 5' DNA nuclease